MSTHDFAAVRAALARLPDRCRYHGDRLDSDRPSYGREACCETGVPARRRRLAEEALQRLEQSAAKAEREQAAVDGSGICTATFTIGAETRHCAEPAGHYDEDAPPEECDGPPGCHRSVPDEHGTRWRWYDWAEGATSHREEQP